MHTQSSQFPDAPYDVAVLIAESLSHGLRADRTPAVPAKTLSNAARAARGWLDRLDHWFWQSRQRDIEAYLAQATDVADLERRLGALERGVEARYY